MWVADMDFRTPPFVMDALKKRLEHEVLGYTFACEEWYTSICAWLRDRHGWDISREMLTFVPGLSVDRLLPCSVSLIRVIK